MPRPYRHAGARSGDAALTIRTEQCALVQLLRQFPVVGVRRIVCASFNDLFVALLDSSHAGAPTNPADKNLATHTTPQSSRYLLTVNLARDQTGLFTQCVNGVMGCASGNTQAMAMCTDAAGLAGTGMDVPTPDQCDASSLRGGGTGWLTVRGNVVPGEIITLRLALWDTGDDQYDSLILLDNFHWSGANVAPGLSRD